MNNHEHARIADYSDREIMAMITDLNGSDGYVTPSDVAVRAFGLASDDEENIKYFARCVTARLTWMKRFGLTERIEVGKWTLTSTGRAMLTTRPPKAVVDGIVSSREDAALNIANLVGERLNTSGFVAAKAMEREIKFQAGRRWSR